MLEKDAAWDISIHIGEGKIKQDSVVKDDGNMIQMPKMYRKKRFPSTIIIEKQTQEYLNCGIYNLQNSCHMMQ